MRVRRIDVVDKNDATAEIQAALDEAQFGDTLILPAGVYRVRQVDGGAALRIARSGVTLRGEGVGATVIELAPFAESRTAGIVRDAPGAVVTIRDLTIDGGQTVDRPSVMAH